MNTAQSTSTATAEESEVALFYDQHDALYRSFWDREGSLHWGFFYDFNSTDFAQACRDWDNIMKSRVEVLPSSRILDVGCGNGVTSLWLAETTECSVTGIDVSGVRIAAAQQALAGQPQLQAEFVQGSATKLPFEDGKFDAAWSQASLYHIADRSTALREIGRVVADGAVFVLDDLTTPPGIVSDVGRQYVYERLLFDRGFSRDQYIHELNAAGFVVYEMRDLTAHLRRSYLLLRDLAGPVDPDLANAYEHVVEAIDAGDVQWTFFACERVVDRLDWIYRNDHPRPLAERYNAWSTSYDSDLGTGWSHVPSAAATLLHDTLGSTHRTVLDVGCGTGLCGVALAANGYSDVAGADLSPGMLKVAADRGVYTRLEQWNIATDPSPFSGDVAGVLSIGVFTYGHASGKELSVVRSLLAPEGIAIISYRPEFLAAESKFAEELNHPEWQVVARRELTIFESERLVMVALQRKKGQAS